MPSASPALPVCFCFAGQGSQYHHMGDELMRDEPVFRQWMEIGDAIVKRERGFSPLEKIYDRNKRIHDPFDTLDHSHPALFMVQFALAKMLQAKGTRADMLMGVSLGEFVAMSVAGMIPFERALKLVARQPEIFARTCPPGTLIAVLAPASIRGQSPVLAQASETAGINAESHHVLACPETETMRVSEELRRLDVPFQKLPLPFAFHSRWIEPAREAYLADISQLTFETPFWPVWSACFGKPIDGLQAVQGWEIARARMQLKETVNAMEAQGGARYLDCSPTGTLAAVLRQCLGNGQEIETMLSPFGSTRCLRAPWAAVARD